MNVKTKDYIEEILELRSKNISYEGIATWLAVNRKFSVTGAAVRSALLVYENKQRAK